MVASVDVVCRLAYGNGLAGVTDRFFLRRGPVANMPSVRMR